MIGAIVAKKAKSRVAHDARNRLMGQKSVGPD
jgi:hypothetical protein